MKFSILIPHYKQGKITAYTISQLLKYKGKHEIEILVVDNNFGDGSNQYLKPFKNEVKYQAYPKDMLQSHGISFDYVLPYVNTEWFITIESDAFPTQDNWLDYYESLINDGNDCAGSLLQLSGGEYIHPAGALYNKKVWQEAKVYCNEVQYIYMPNMSTREGFDCHLMIHKSVAELLLKKPYDYIELAENYKGFNQQFMIEKMMYYSPVVAPFHNGMGNVNESIKTYGQRSIASEVPNILLENKKKLIHRIGYEPGQWFCYWQLAMGKKVSVIPTEIKWLPNRENQQQEYTLMENGLRHIWAGSSYLDMKDTDFNDVYEAKSTLIEELYNSLPEHQKIKQ